MGQILIVDDNPKNIQLLGNILSDQKYEVEYAMNGIEAIEAVDMEDFNLILMDVMMPEMDGYEACQRIKEMERKSEIPIIFITAKTDVSSIQRGFEVGGVDYIAKPFESQEVLARVKTHLELKEAKDKLKNQNEILERKVEERTRDLILTQEVAIQSLASLAETRDNETGGHIRRTQSYVKLLVQEALRRSVFAPLLNKKTAKLLWDSAPLHDMGKVGIPDSILRKPGKLTDEEFNEMKKHTNYGRESILRAEQSRGSNTFLQLAREIAYTHHEKWDGTGYPRQLRGEEIPISGRFMAVADVYDALVCKRVYKDPFPHSKAVEIIQESSGTHFCPNIVEIFLAVQEDFYKIAYEYADTPAEKNALDG